MSDLFDHRVTDLSGLYRDPHPVVVAKSVDVIDPVTAAYIASSPFVAVATASAAGPTDVSPRGGPPGFVKVVDEKRLAIPDLNGNNRLDTLHNIIERPWIGLIFLVPGKDETLRVNGKACITTDPAILDLFEEFRRPVAAIGIEVQECYIHCAKAFRRSGLWQPDTWTGEGPSSSEVYIAQHQVEGLTAEMLDADLEAGYAEGLAYDKPVVCD